MNQEIGFHQEVRTELPLQGTGLRERKFVMPKFGFAQFNELILYFSDP